MSESRDDRAHDFFQLMRLQSMLLVEAARRVADRAKEDPGTAGDSVEELWADVLRNWLPATLPIETKGRLLYRNGSASPQVDILILDPNYPRALRTQKYFFSGGVLGIVECKLSLRRPDLIKSIRTACSIKRSMHKYEKPNIEALFGHDVVRP